MTDAQTPKIKKKRSLSLIWFIPLIAVAMGGWVFWQKMSEEGPKIEIHFKTAAGLVAGKTQIRLRELQVGLITKLELSKDLKTVTAYASMNKDMDPYLNANTKFWVVRPRIDRQGISGIGTLLSGAYITMNPGKQGESVSSFMGLDAAPLTPDNAPGLRVILYSQNANSIDVGTPIYYRGISVGQVERRYLSKDYKHIEFDLFIKEPYSKFVFKNTKFWNTSGFDWSVNADGIKFHTGPVETLLTGGISFDIPEGVTADKPANYNENFPLYKSKKESTEINYSNRVILRTYFNGSVRGLVVGSPVEIRGIKIGKVLNINLEFDEKMDTIRVPVTFYIDPDRIGGDTSKKGFKDLQDKKSFFSALVRKGLRTNLRMGSLITGQLFIDTDFYPKAKVKKLTMEGNIPIIPSVPSTVEVLTKRVNGLLEKLEKLPLEKFLNNSNHLVTDARTSFRKINGLLGKSSTQKLPDKLSTLLSTLNTTAKIGQELLKSVKPGSPLYYDLRKTLQEVSKAAKSVKSLAETLDDNPQSLIRGR